MLASSDQQVATTFKQRLEKIVPILDMRVFGSRARGDATTESDLDIFIEVEIVTPELRQQIREMAWEVGFARDLVISTFVATRQQVEKSALRASPFLHNVLRGRGAYMTPDQLTDLLRYRIEQARESLSDAQILLAEGSLRGTINRAYYAMFYGVLALLATRQLGTSKHSGAIALFDREFVKNGVFSTELSKALHVAFDLRQTHDYGEFIELEEQAVEAALHTTQHFIDVITQYLNEAGYGVDL